MAFQEGESLYLQGEDGRRYWFRYEPGMVKLGGMGTVDGSRFKDLEDGDSVEIVGKRFNVFRPGVIEMIESLDRGAQIITPTLASLFINNKGYRIIGVYSAVCTLLAFCAFLTVRHGDVKVSFQRAFDDAATVED